MHAMCMQLLLLYPASGHVSRTHHWLSQGFEKTRSNIAIGSSFIIDTGSKCVFVAGKFVLLDTHSTQETALHKEDFPTNTALHMMRAQVQLVLDACHASPPCLVLVSCSADQLWPLFVRSS